jgi:hypothetical protein
MSDSADLAQLKHLYELPGPFVTVQLDATRSTEQAEHEIALRWRSVRDHLADSGAAEGDLSAVAAAVAEDRTPGPHGLVVVAAGGSVVFSGTLDEPPAHDTGTVSRLPHLMPYLAGRVQHVPHLLVVADRTGADIGVGPNETESVDGDRHPVHRTGRDDWSERHFQNRVENTWEANARDVVDEVIRRANGSGAELIVLAGDERATALIRAGLEAANGPPVSQIPGGRSEGGAPPAEAVRDAVLHHVWARRRELLEHLRQNLGRERYAAAGVPDVVVALRQGQVDAVVLSHDPSSTLRAWVGPQPLDFALDKDDLLATGVTDPVEDRLDAALLRAVVGSGARLLITPNAHDYVADGIGALLRYEV